MAGYNRIVIMGNLTRDPEYKQLSSGQAVCRLGLACNRQFKNRQTGAMVQEVCYIDVDVWGAQAESCKQYLQKGRPVLIEGRLKYDTWEDQEGKSRSKHSVVADRVMFLASSSSMTEQENSEEGEAVNSASSNRMSAARLDTEVEIDAALSKQIKEVKARTQSKVKKQTEEATEQAAATFTDEPPFQDDLPF